MDLILDFDINQTPHSACFQLKKIPLHCNKTAWNAETKGEWNKEYLKYISTRPSHGLLIIADWRLSKQVDMVSLGYEMIADLSSWSTDPHIFGSIILIGV